MADVKNTFLHFNERDKDEEAVMRQTQSVPFSFFGGSAEDRFQVCFADVLEEGDFEDDEDKSKPDDDTEFGLPSGDSADCMVHSMSYEAIHSPTSNVNGTARSGGISRSSLMQSRVRAVKFFTPEEPARLVVKNTFLQMPDQEGSSPPMRTAQSMPVVFAPELMESNDPGSSPFASMRNCDSSRFGGDEASPAYCHWKTNEASTPITACSLHPLTFNDSDPQGPHLGLLWAPEGHIWGPQPENQAAQLFPVPTGPSSGSTPRRVDISGPPGIHIAAQQKLAPSWNTEADRRRLGAEMEQPRVVRPSNICKDGGLTLSLNELWEMSVTQQGCRDVQTMLEEASNDEARTAIAMHMHGRAAEAMRNPYANYVLAKIITTLPPQRCQFIIAELMAEKDVSQVARHKFGCRIVQRLFERCCPEQVKPLANVILQDFASVSRHPYGNYVIQNLMDNGTVAQKHAIFAMIHADVASLSSDVFGCTVLCAALDPKRPREVTQRIARVIAGDPGLLVFTACTRHGHGTIANVLKVLEGDEVEAVRNSLRAEINTLRASRFGRNLLDFL